MKNLALLIALITLPLLAACGDKRPNVILQTKMGPIEIEVYQDAAPISGGDFLYYVDNGLYDGQGFYRVVRADNDPLKMDMGIVQGGRLDALPLTADIAHETTTKTGLSNQIGTISIARDEPGSGSAAYFFINTSNNPFLDTGGNRNPDGQGYASFGKVVAGMDIVLAIQAKPTGRPADAKIDAEADTSQMLSQPVIIERAYRK